MTSRSLLTPSTVAERRQLRIGERADAEPKVRIARSIGLAMSTSTARCPQAIGAVPDAASSPASEDRSINGSGRSSK
jgi:hypothetical protein